MKKQDSLHCSLLKIKPQCFISLFIITLFIFNSCKSKVDANYATWNNYGGTKEMIRYSSLTQVDTNNVAGLKVAWIYNSGDADSVNNSQMQCNPIVINGILYGVNPQMKLFAVDAATGKEIWVFDANSKTSFDEDRKSLHIMINSRGIAYWTDGKKDNRIFFTAGSETYAIDALTGKPVLTFGNNGYIDLHDGLGRDVKNLFVISSSPGIVYKDLLIMGTRVDETMPAAPGHVRAYDVRTGKQQWIFHTIPQPGEYGYETWEDPVAWKHAGAANAWSGFSLDEQRGIVFVATGSASYDFYGGKRLGSNLFANSLLALDAKNGKRIWHFQFIHHDLWDMDLPSPPALVRLNQNGRQIDAVAQTTKTGMVYVFERATGKPVFEIEEVPVDTITTLAGEKVWPTQPIPKKPAAFVRQTITINDVNPYLPDSIIKKLKKELQKYRHGNMFIPPGMHTSLVLPGYGGGAEWGGPAFDPESGIFYVNANEQACLMEMQENKINKPVNENNLQAGIRVYQQNCVSCHEADKKGNTNFPSLENLNTKYSHEEFITLLSSGRRMMPAFNQISTEEKNAIASYVLDQKREQVKAFISTDKSINISDFMPYKLKGYTRFKSPDGYPGIKPPWGTLNAIDLNTGEILWQTPLGEYEELKAKGIPPTGTENFGGPVVTAGGLVFIAASRDGKMRAFNKKTGKVVWEYQLPAPGFATPAVYEIKGKQYIVIACGGGKLGTTSSDAYIAFALP
jgi:quinoprotein glucose dehydrogenase